MGYYKNKLIEQQVELGDRVPAPKPASEHAVFYVPAQSRRFIRNLEAQHEAERRRIAWSGGLLGFGIGLIGGLIGGLSL